MICALCASQFHIDASCPRRAKLEAEKAMGEAWRLDPKLEPVESRPSHPSDDMLLRRRTIRMIRFINAIDAESYEADG